MRTLDQALAASSQSTHTGRGLAQAGRAYTVYAGDAASARLAEEARFRGTTAGGLAQRCFLAGYAALCGEGDGVVRAALEGGLPARMVSPERASETVGGFPVPAAPSNAEEPASGSVDENTARLSEDTAATASDRNWAATKRGCESVTAGETAPHSELPSPPVQELKTVAGDEREGAAPDGPPGAAPVASLGVSSLDLAPPPASGPAEGPPSGEPSAADVAMARAYRSVNMSAREIAKATGWTVPFAKRAIELARRA